MTWHRTCRMAMKIHKNTPPSQDLVWAGLTRRASHRLEPGLRLVEDSEIAADLDLRLALFVVRFGQARDLAEELSALLVQLHLGHDLAGLVVDRLPRPRHCVARAQRAGSEEHGYQHHSQQLGYRQLRG